MWAGCPSSICWQSWQRWTKYVAGTGLKEAWGVNALVGRQTRSHRDVDIDIDGAFEDEVLTALGELGYAVETDWRPNRVELAAPGRGWVDVHPLVLDDMGNARQAPDLLIANGRDLLFRTSPTPCPGSLQALQPHLLQIGGTSGVRGTNGPPRSVGHGDDGLNWS